MWNKINKQEQSNATIKYKQILKWLFQAHKVP